MRNHFKTKIILLPALLWSSLAIAAPADDFTACTIGVAGVHTVIGPGSPFADGKMPSIPDRIAACERVTASNTVDPKLRATAFHALGVAHNQLNMEGAALTYFTRALELDPQRPRSHMERAFIYEKLGRLQSAVDECGKAIAFDPKDPEPIFLRGYMLHKAGHPDRARADYDAAIAINPKFAAALTNRALIRINAGDFDGAFADYDAAIAATPDHYNAYYNRGRAYAARRDFTRAMADFDKTIALNPDFLSAYYNRGMLFRDNNILDRAIADFDAVLKGAPEDAQTWNARGGAFLLANNRQQARASFDQAIRHDAKLINAYNNRFEVLIEEREFALALSDADAMVKLAPQAARSHQARGEALQNLGRKDDAIAAYRQSLALKPANHVRDRAVEGLKGLGAEP